LRFGTVGGTTEAEATGTTNMRAVLIVLIIIVLAILAAVATGFLDINQIRGAKAPQLSTTSNGVMAKGGQTPAFDVETGSVKVGTVQKSMKVPTVSVVKPADNQAAPAPANSQ
jgi:cytochrome c556